MRNYAQLTDPNFLLQTNNAGQLINIQPPAGKKSLLANYAVDAFNNVTGLMGPNGNTIPIDANALPNVWYVNAHAVAGGNGSMASPFNTIQAAINAASNFDTIYLTMGGLHLENIVMRDLEAISIIGMAECNTIVQNATASHTFSWVPAAVSGALVTKGAMTNVEWRNTDTTGTYRAFHIDASAVVAPNVFMGDEWDLNFTDISGSGTAGQTAAYFKNTGVVYWTHGQVTGGDLSLINTSVFRTRQVEIGSQAVPMNANVTYDGNLPAYNLIGRGDVTFAQASVVWGNLIPNGHPIVQVDSTSMVVGTTGGGHVNKFLCQWTRLLPTVCAQWPIRARGRHRRSN